MVYVESVQLSVEIKKPCMRLGYGQYFNHQLVYAFILYDMKTRKTVEIENNYLDGSVKPNVARSRKSEATNTILSI